ncbi:late competence development ComFB family protein [Anaerovibrio sp.]|uniref:late competence development ComFB family protein n=1 Tax=Anaerovibrio sp. TaxID=1872532 RepID=UPI003890B0CC
MAVEVKNVVEIFVDQYLDKTLDNIPGVCRCEQCVADIKAITLNSMKPKYVSSSRGEVLSKLKAFDQGNQVELLCIVKKAADMVMTNPHHEVVKKKGNVL